MEQPGLPEILETITENGNYVPFEGSGYSGLARRDWVHSGQDPIEVLKKIDDPAARRCKSGRKVYAVTVGEVFIKRYNFQGWWNGFRRLFKVPRPERVLAGAVRLKEFEIPTPEVLVAARRSKHWIPYDDYLITRVLSTHQLPLDKEAGEFAQGDPYRQFVSGVTALLVKMHESYPIYHNENVLKVIGNAVRWAKPVFFREMSAPKYPALEEIRTVDPGAPKAGVDQNADGSNK